MDIRRRIISSLPVLLLLVLMGCKASPADAILDDRITILDKSPQLGNQMANSVFEDLQKYYLEPLSDRYKFENPRMKVYYEKEKDGLVKVDVRIMADISWRRDGEDSPFIQGMRELQEELRHWHEHPDDAEYAEQVIDGWLLELNAPLDKEPDEPDYGTVVELVFKPGEDEYTINGFYTHTVFYSVDEFESITETIPLEQYSREILTEDVEQEKLEGRQRVWEALYMRYTYGDLYKDSIYGDLYND